MREKQKIAYSAVICACENGKEPHQALHVLKEMLLRGSFAKAIPYNAALCASEDGQMPKQAVHLLQDMLPRGLLPTVTTYKSAASECEKGQAALPGRAAGVGIPAGTA